MIEIHGSADCGNSPKNRFVQDMAIALATGEIEPDNVAGDVCWDRGAGDEIEGRDALVRKLAAQAAPVVVTVEHAISHGKVGAASGWMKMQNGARKRFSHVFLFTNTKADCVGVIRSYS